MILRHAFLDRYQFKAVSSQLEQKKLIILSKKSIIIIVAK
jgi:hypothetical protein